MIIIKYLSFFTFLLFIVTCQKEKKKDMVITQLKEQILHIERNSNRLNLKLEDILNQLSILKYQIEDNQGTQSWLDETKYSWGGSSASLFLGGGDDLGRALSRRLFDESFESIHMSFGSVLEDPARMSLAKKLKTDIHVLGAVPYKKSDR